VFQNVWNDIAERYGDVVPLPRQVVWLAGAPGSGKGTNTSHILNARNIKSAPIVMSAILDSPTCKAIKAVGGMVNDKVVLTALLEEMGKPEYREGVIVDGFPRTALQVEFIHLIHENYVRMYGVKPDYRVAVFHVAKEESITRQLNRGVELKLENAQRALKGLSLLESRPTDLDPVHAATRYHSFSVHYEHLVSMSTSYPFHLIDATGTKDDVRKIIEKDLAKEKAKSRDVAHEDSAEIPNFDFVGAMREAISMRMAASH